MEGKQARGARHSNGVQKVINPRKVTRLVSLLIVVCLLFISLAACSENNSDSAAKSNSEAARAQQVFSDSSTTEPSAYLMNNSVQVTTTSGAATGETEQRQSSTAVQQNVNESGGGSGIGPIADANAGFDRKVIYRANLIMKVAEFASAEEELQNLIHLSGAYILQFSDSQNKNEVGATYVIKVPSQGFSPFLDKLQEIKSLKLERKVEGNDVTEEFVDLESRLKAKQAVEARLLAFMDKATRSEDLIQFSNQLANVQEEIETIKGRIRYIDQNVAFSTINLRLYQTSGIQLSPEENEEKSFTDKLAHALSDSTKVLRQFGEGLLIVVAAMVPVVLVLSIIGIPVYFFIRRRQRHRHKTEIKPLADEQEQLDTEEDR